MFTTLLAVAAVIAFTAGSATAGTQSAGAVTNDDLAQATVVTSIPFADAVDLVPAGTEPDEPTASCHFLSNTVWYALTLPAETAVTVDTAGSATDAIVVVWDDHALLEPVACANNNATSLQAKVDFVARADVTYLIQVGIDGQTGTPSGPLRLTMAKAQRPTGALATAGHRRSLNALRRTSEQAMTLGRVAHVPNLLDESVGGTTSATVTHGRTSSARWRRGAM